MFTNSLRIGVVRGGMGSTFNHSLESGAHILRKLPTKYIGIDIFIDKEGIWHIGGLPILPERALAQVDIVANALLGEYNTASSLARLCDTHQIPYTGGGALACSLALHKEFSKKHIQQNGLKVPFGIVAEKLEARENLIQKIFDSLSGTLVARPMRGGVSESERIIRGHHELPPALDELFALYDALVIEEYIHGLPLSVSVVENFRGKPLYAFIPMEIKMGESESERKGVMYPARSLSDNVKERAVTLAKKLHTLFGARHYSQSRVVLHASGALYVTDFDTHPYLGPDGTFMKTLTSVGARPEEFIDCVVSNVMNR